jgi:hypothetical protein
MVEADGQLYMSVCHTEAVKRWTWKMKNKRELRASASEGTHQSNQALYLLKGSKSASIACIIASWVITCTTWSSFSDARKFFLFGKKTIHNLQLKNTIIMEIQKFIIWKLKVWHRFENRNEKKISVSCFNIRTFCLLLSLQQPDLNEINGDMEVNWVFTLWFFKFW